MHNIVLFLGKMLLQESPKSFRVYNVPSAASVIFRKNSVIRKIFSNLKIYHFEVVNHIYECNKLQEPVKSSSTYTIITTDLSADSTLIHSTG